MTEAQRLAKFMAVEGELHRSQGRETLAGYFGQAAAHLRRLEAECEQLRAALVEIKAFVCGSSVPRWDTTDHTYASREAIANRVDAAIAKETK